MTERKNSKDWKTALIILLHKYTQDNCIGILLLSFAINFGRPIQGPPKPRIDTTQHT